MINLENLNPSERLDVILKAGDFSKTTLIAYFLYELAHQSKFKRFDDTAYWLDVEDEFYRRLKDE